MDHFDDLTATVKELIEILSLFFVIEMGWEKILKELILIGIVMTISQMIAGMEAYHSADIRIHLSGTDGVVVCVDCEAVSAFCFFIYHQRSSSNIRSVTTSKASS